MSDDQLAAQIAGEVDTERAALMWPHVITALRAIEASVEFAGPDGERFDVLASALAERVNPEAGITVLAGAYLAFTLGGTPDEIAEIAAGLANALDEGDQ